VNLSAISLTHVSAGEQRAVLSCPSLFTVVHKNRTTITAMQRSVAMLRTTSRRLPRLGMLQRANMCSVPTEVRPAHDKHVSPSPSQALLRVRR
jgi:hypothetical protein